MGCCLSIEQQNLGVVERFGKYERVLKPGLNCLNPITEELHSIVSLKVSNKTFNVETKTKDNVFVIIDMNIQYGVIPTKVVNAVYDLDAPLLQIEAYITSTLRSEVPRMDLDDVFESKNDLAMAVENELQSKLSEHGFQIIACLVNDVEPDARVKNAMNEINTQERLLSAATTRAEANKQSIILQAEGSAEAERLSGLGLARQRKAIVNGLSKSIRDFGKSIPNSTTDEVMQMVMMNQYYDTLKSFDNAKTVFLPSVPNSHSALMQDVSTAMFTEQQR